LILVLGFILSRRLKFFALALALSGIAGCDRTAGVTYRVVSPSTAVEAIKQAADSLGFTAATEEAEYPSDPTVLSRYVQRGARSGEQPLSITVWQKGDALLLFVGRPHCCGVSVEEEALVRDVVRAVVASGVSLSEPRILGLRAAELSTPLSPARVPDET
jgi:hypothetical protein